jgi:hypothetical protein
MGRSRPISVAEAATLKKQSQEAILKATRTGRLIHHQLSGKGLMLCREQVLGKDFDERAWRAECRRYVSVPDACDICRKTDAAVIRDLAAGRISGFKLNPKAWAVLRESAEQEFRDYLARSASTSGRKRDLISSRSPRSLRKKKSLTPKAAKVQSARVCK